MLRRRVGQARLVGREPAGRATASAGAVVVEVVPAHHGPPPRPATVSVGPVRAEDARRYALLLSYGRIGLGVTALAAPRLPSLPWVGGTEARRASVQLLARGLGARDVALGLGPVLALRRNAPARGWVEAGGLADAGDLLGTLIAWRTLPRSTRLVMLGVIGASLVASRVLAPSVE